MKIYGKKVNDDKTSKVLIFPDFPNILATNSKNNALMSQNKNIAHKYPKSPAIILASDNKLPAMVCFEKNKNKELKQSVPAAKNIVVFDFISEKSFSNKTLYKFSTYFCILTPINTMVYLHISCFGEESPVLRNFVILFPAYLRSLKK